MPGCGSESARWIHVAGSFEPAGREAATVPSFLGADLTLRPVVGEGAVWAESTIKRADWRASAFPGVVMTRVPIAGVGHPSDGSPRRTLEAEGWDFPIVEDIEDVLELERLPPGSFTAAGDQVFLVTGDEEPPERTVHRVYVDRGSRVDGAWRVALPHHSGEGIPVWSGSRETVVLDIPTHSALRFATAAFAYSASAPDPAGSIVFRIALEGEPIFEHEQEVGPSGECAWHAVTLPARGADDAVLVFEVEGPAAHAAFLAPVIGPRDVGSYGARPWEGDPPDVVLFLADTFRADNLGAYGGELALTPELDRFAEESLLFERTWASSSWTLPSQSSMFTGLFPYQHTAVTRFVTLPEELTTLAEHLQRAGYRTGAVTDSVYVSHAYGLDQGFEWFRERWIDLETTLAAVRAFLAADDGRPVFLFVHTYETHVPYDVDARTRTER
ncbi:MAG: sulfatase-like hydrolase/transferase, partial [Planctomycetota bacterium]|nr:sulfatase-like hydrolase/transferase [Planctomycetota bacterium]